MSSDEAFLKRLRESFLQEAGEHCRGLSRNLLELEKAPDEQAQRIVGTLFREAHSLKGAARAVGAAPVETLCQLLESVFSAMQRGDRKPGPEGFDVLHRATDTVLALATAAPGDPELPLGPTVEELTGLEARLSSGSASRPPPAGPAPPPAERRPSARRSRKAARSPAPPRDDAPQTAAPEGQQEGQPAGSVRVAVEKLERMCLRAEELLAVRLALELRTLEAAALASLLHRSGAAAAPSAGGLSPERLLQQLARHLEADRVQAAELVEGLLEESRQVLMMPFASQLEALPRMIRDISRQEDKEASWSVQGESLEVDRRVLEAVKVPLIHLVRNAVHYGIEAPEQRRRAGKPARGNIRIAVGQPQTGRIEVTVSDDGAGVDIEAVREAAVRKGLLSPRRAAELSRQETLELIFVPELTTSPIISDISGRGIGLSIVKERLDELGGGVAVESEAGRGTVFRLRLPVSLATARGIVVRLGKRLFVLPTGRVERVLEIDRQAIRTVEARDTVAVGDRVLPYVPLRDLLELPPAESGEPGGLLQVLVVSSSLGAAVVGVDEVLYEREVLVKALGKQLARVRHVSGATELGSGQLVPVLNVSDLVASALRAPGGREPGTGAQQPGTGAQQPGTGAQQPGTGAQQPGTGAQQPGSLKGARVLVAEDSITSRALLKQILQTAGCEVATAVDGTDAWNALQTGKFELLVSDVDMPRTDGFELTRMVRADARLRELPVILVTALGSREDRERGVAAGANAYIVKSSFDQGNLLGAARRLI